MSEILLCLSDVRSMETDDVGNSTVRAAGAVRRSYVECRSDVSLREYHAAAFMAESVAFALVRQQSSPAHGNLSSLSLH